ncbi:MAG TPA: hypothetical protein VJ353_16280 [Xanthobacteraceae bacterium]|nr:hypothetical protein [Xanthobacteraceae bacterium]
MKRGMLRSCSRVLFDRAPVVALLALACVLPGCSGGSSGMFGGPAATATAEPPPPPPPAPATAAAAPPPLTAAASPSSNSLKDKIENFFSTAGAAHDPRPVVNTQQADVDCPLIDIRQGAGTLTIPLPPPDGSNDAMSLKYQGTFVRAARDCKVVNGQLAMKIGVQGRVIVGPAGGPGQIEVPLRLAVVDQTPSGSHTIVTKLVLVPVMVTSDDAGAIFTHIEDNFAFPLPSSAELDNYVVYIGFDPIGAQQQERSKPQPAPRMRPRPKPKPNPNAPTG